MKRYFPLIFVAALIFYKMQGKFYWPWERKKVQETVKLFEKSDSDLTCAKTEKCLMVYVAPWCGACKQFLTEFYPHLLPLIQNYNQTFKVGVEIIIGMDSKENMEKMAKEYNITAYHPDSNKEFQKNLKVSVVPTFIASKNNGKIIGVKEGFSARGSTIENAAHNFLKDILDL